MADLIRKNSEPTSPDPGGGKRSIGAIALVSAIIFFVLAIVFKKFIFAVAGGGLLVFGSVFMISDFASAPAISQKKAYGNMGERKAGLIFEHYLPEGFTVIQNVSVGYDSGTSEIDNVIVGETGVFVVEVKNVKGTLSGDFSHNYWVQDKIDNYDIKHQKTLYNPVKQTSTHIYRLSGILRENGVSTFIKGAVYFANPETKIDITGENEKNIPVFTAYNTNSLLDYIEKGKAKLNRKQIEKIISLLE